MAIKIDLESTKIPVEIGDLKFEINVADDKYEAFLQSFEKFISEAKDIDEENIEVNVRLKELLQKTYDELLGKGAFKKVYAKIPNISFVTGVLTNLFEHLVLEIEKRSLGA